MSVSEVLYENGICPGPSGVVHAVFWLPMRALLDFLGPMGIVSPILLVLLGLWLGRGDRSPWYAKTALLAALAVLFLIVFGYL